MNALVLHKGNHNYQVIPRTPLKQAPGIESPTAADTKGHPCFEFNSIFVHRRLDIPTTSVLDPSIILFHRGAEGSCTGLQAKMMGVGRISDVLGLKDVIPDSGPVDVELLGGLIWDVARRINWIGADYGCARALCAYQQVIPNQPRFSRLKFLFGGTIIFDDRVGIAIPMLEKRDDAWVITHRNILDQVVPGVDLCVG